VLQLIGLDELGGRLSAGIARARRRPGLAPAQYSDRAIHPISEHEDGDGLHRGADVVGRTMQVGCGRQP
jgi:hypothetical protein